MKQQITAESWRKQEREKINKFSDKIDEYYSAFFELAKYASEIGVDATRIQTPYGDYTIVFKKNDFFAYESDKL